MYPHICVPRTRRAHQYTLRTQGPCIVLYYGKGLGALWPPLWADLGMDPAQTLRLPPALEGIPVGHQLLQAFLVLEDGWQLLLGWHGGGGG